MKKYLTLSVDEEKLDEVADYWDDKMPMMAMEEMGELIQAISKLERKGKAVRSNLVEEIRDVYISLMALQYRYNIQMSEIEEEIEKKLNMKKDR